MRHGNLNIGSGCIAAMRRIIGTSVIEDR